MQNNEYLTWIGALSLAVIIHAAVLLNISSDWEILRHYPQDAKNLSIDFSFIKQQSQIEQTVKKTIKPIDKATTDKKKFISQVTDNTKADILDSDKFSPLELPEELPEELPGELAVESAEELSEEIQAEPETTSATAPAKNLIQTDRYIHQLLAHIERHKYYPTSARRRGMAGAVTIELSVDYLGNINKLDTHSEYSVLSNAARQTILASAPLPGFNNSYESPMHLTFNIKYELD